MYNLDTRSDRCMALILRLFLEFKNMKILKVEDEC